MGPPAMPPGVTLGSMQRLYVNIVQSCHTTVSFGVWKKGTMVGIPVLVCKLLTTSGSGYMYIRHLFTTVQLYSCKVVVSSLVVQLSQLFSCTSGSSGAVPVVLHATRYS